MSRSRQRFIRQIPSLHHEHEAYRWWVLASVMIGTFMAVLDATIVNVALPKIMATFGITIDQVEWVITAYMLVFAVMLPTSGWVADHFGYKRTYMVSLFIFTFGSFLCSMSWDQNALIFFRIIQGSGAGLMMPVGMAIVTREFPPEKRGIAIGFWSIAAAASVSLGPMIGGYLVDHFTWHTIFDVNIPVGIVGMAAVYMIQREFKTEKARSFDYVGFVSMSLFLSFLILALNEGNAAWNTGGWTSTYILTCFAISLVSLVIFLIVEFSVAHPLIELRLLKNFNFGFSNLVLFIFGLGMFGSTFLLPLYLQNSLGYTALQAGLVFLPVGILQGIFSPISGYIADRFSPKFPALIGIVMLGLSLYWNHTLSLYSEHSQIMAPLYLRGVAMGFVFTPLSALALQGISREKMAQASGMFNVIRQIGGSFGIAILSTVLTRRIIYHSAIYGGAVNAFSPAFRQATSRLQAFAQHRSGGTLAVAGAKAKALLFAEIQRQSFVSGVDDDFFIAGIITLACTFFILILRTRSQSVKKKPMIINE